MIAQDAILVKLVRLIDRVPPPRTHPCLGRPVVYSERLFLEALVIMIVRRLHKVHELLAVLAEPAPANTGSMLAKRTLPGPNASTHSSKKTCLYTPFVPVPSCRMPTRRAAKDATRCSGRSCASR
jgi:hypothetical protein